MDLSAKLFNLKHFVEIPAPLKPSKGDLFRYVRHVVGNGFIWGSPMKITTSIGTERQEVSCIFICKAPIVELEFLLSALFSLHIFSLCRWLVLLDSTTENRAQFRYREFQTSVAAV